MTESQSNLRQRTHGRLDRSRDPAIPNAALEMLAEHDYDATNMNDIAARARSPVTREASAHPMGGYK